MWEARREPRSGTFLACTFEVQGKKRNYLIQGIRMHTIKKQKTNKKNVYHHALERPFHPLVFYNKQKDETKK